MLSLLLIAAPAMALEAPTGPVLNDADGPTLTLSAELGLLDVVTHTYQAGKAGTNFDFVADGGQDVLFPFARLSGDLALGDRHHVGLLYQPLDLETREILSEDLVVDDELFAAGTPLNTRYSFPFWRISYLNDLNDDPDQEFALGASLQIRNATIDFESGDGSQRSSNRDVGPVPVLKLRTRNTLGQGDWWFGTEVDGFYAPIKYINGSNTDVVGAIVDASGRLGLRLNGATDTFLNVRYLAGGGEGTGQNSDGRGDGYNKNWLQFLSVSLGFSLR